MNKDIYKDFEEQYFYYLREWVYGPRKDLIYYISQEGLTLAELILYDWADYIKRGSWPGRVVARILVAYACIKKLREEFIEEEDLIRIALEKCQCTTMSGSDVVMAFKTSKDEKKRKLLDNIIDFMDCNHETRVVN